METFSGTGRPGDEEVLRLSDELQRGQPLYSDSGLQNLHSRYRYKKQEIPVVMTGISLLPFYSADATTMLARALLTLQR